MEKAEAARRRELRQRLIGNSLDLCTGLLWSVVPGLMPLAAFWSMIQLKHRPLTVPIAFPALALLDMIRYPLQNLPEAVAHGIRVLISCRRVQRFYDEPDLAPVPTVALAPGSASPEIRVRAARFAHARADDGQPGKPPFCLEMPDVTFAAPSLTLVCGPTASGKSSLLLALAGELDRSEPNALVYAGLQLRGVAYASQVPWIEQGTIREAVCFGCAYDADRFRRVAFACGLEPDLRELPYRGETAIGEFGQTLSGGQAARVALARAVYSPARFLLLDDPLSAVDVDTARHLLEHCLRGPLLRDRCVVMATHHEALCRGAATRTLRLEAGRVTVEERLVDVAHDEPADAMPTEMKSIEQLLGQALPPGTGKDILIDEEYRQAGAVKWRIYSASSIAWSCVLTLS